MVQAAGRSCDSKLLGLSKLGLTNMTLQGCPPQGHTSVNPMATVTMLQWSQGTPKAILYHTQPTPDPTAIARDGALTRVEGHKKPP